MFLTRLKNTTTASRFHFLEGGKDLGQLIFLHRRGGEGGIFRCFAVCTPVCSMMACSRISANSVAEPSLVRILLANWFECRYRPDIWICNDDRYEARSRASGSRVSCAAHWFGNPTFEFYYNAPLGSWKLAGNWMIDNNCVCSFRDCEDCEEVWRGELMRVYWERIYRGIYSGN